MIHRIIMIMAIFALAITACEIETGSSKLNPIVTWPAGFSALPGETLADISLDAYTNNGTPGAFSWATPHHTVGDTLGDKHSHRMTFTPTDTATYNTVTKDIAVLVSLIEMVRVRGGTYTMGSPSDEPGRNNSTVTETQFEVTVNDDFYLGRYEVTQAQWYEVMGLTIQQQQALQQATLTDNYGWGDNRPVYSVSFYEALVFCNTLSMMEGLDPAYSIDDETEPEWWGDIPEAYDEVWSAVKIVADSNGYRLPDEVQWEYACRAGTKTPWHSAMTESDRANPLSDYAWYNAWWHKEDGSAPVAQAQPVGTKKPNKFGLYDMHGNVSEWCWDRFGNFPTHTDPYGVWVGVGRVDRGSGWNNTANSLRSAARIGITPQARSQYRGFRVARP